MITLQIPSALRLYTNGASEVAVEAVSLRGSLTALREQFPFAYDRILTEPGELRIHVNVFVNQRLVRSLDGADARLSDGDIVTIMPAISGG